MFFLANFLDDLVSVSDKVPPGPGEAAMAMAYSLTLNLIIALLYKLTYKGNRYSQDYVQTLIIIGAVTTILIMVVSGNGAIAFGMFAAFSVIRFRRTLGQSRDLAFVFFAMAIGMVVGARQYAMAAVILGIMGAAIVILSTTDAFAPQKATHKLKIRTSDSADHNETILPILRKFADQYQLVKVSSDPEGMLAELRYDIILKKDANTAQLLEALQQSSDTTRVVITANDAKFES